MDNLVFKDSFVNVLFPLSQLFSVDKIQKIGIFEHLDSTKSLFVVWDSVGEVVGKLTLVMVSVFDNSLLDTFYCEALIVA